VQFYSKPVQNGFRSQQEGRPIFEDADFVKIFLPGDSTLVIDTPAREDHKARFPLQWAHYQNKHGGDSKLIGTPIAQWPLVTAAQAEELKALKFFTVDQIASASDAQLQRLGMVAGMAPHAFRDRAQRFLSVAKQESDVTQSEERIKALQEENARIQAESAAQLKALQEQMAALAAAVNGNEERKRPGRKPKLETQQEAA
jgi:hypothetical protein